MDLTQKIINGPYKLTMANINLEYVIFYLNFLTYQIN